MRIFHCDHCDHLVFFENTACVRCGHLLAFLPDLGEIGSLERVDDMRWRSPLAHGATYRLCRNYREENVCNWALADADPHERCLSCRLTRVVPDLGRQGHREAWYRLEVAKRRLVYTLLALQLPIVDRDDDPVGGLAFEFLADPDDPSQPPVLTGHEHGVIRINVAEADDSERERRRASLHEPYRTLLGHVRHEIGHYYWERLIAASPYRLQTFRAVFGDEREDYAAALQRHYAEGPPADWTSRFVSAYASAHAWEDWAETWAHYLHITDTVETAAACGVSHPAQPPQRAVPEAAAARRGHADHPVRADDGGLVFAHLRAQQPQSRPGIAGRLPLRPLARRRGQAPRGPRGHSGGGIWVIGSGFVGLWALGSRLWRPKAQSLRSPKPRARQKTRYVRPARTAYPTRPETGGRSRTASLVRPAGRGVKRGAAGGRELPGVAVRREMKGRANENAGAALGLVGIPEPLEVFGDFLDAERHTRRHGVAPAARERHVQRVPCRIQRLLKDDVAVQAPAGRVVGRGHAREQHRHAVGLALHAAAGRHGDPEALLTEQRDQQLA